MISGDELRKIFTDVDNLVHVPMPLEDLMECVIAVDVMNIDPELADMFEDWVASWLASGYTDQQVVDIFSAIMVSIYASERADGMMSEIIEFLENKNGE